ncbi:MAG: hypothetical protein GY822_11645 [Deltaproteobacteria bacterium]|nr:hypothetical protein [Deltaproteobacteria bacterium]
MAAVFIPQNALDAWTDQGKTALDNNTLTLLKEERTVDLNPAVRFRSLQGADVDPHQLLGKVKTHSQLDELGAEHYMDSVILGDVAYQVEEGFMGDLSRKKSAEPPVVAAPVVAAPVVAAPVVELNRATVTESSSSLTPTVETPAAQIPGAQVPAPLSIPPLAVEASQTSASSPLEKVLSKSAEGDGDDGTEESDAEALSRLFLDTVQ